MSNIYFISDTHFQHKNILEYEETRGNKFSNIEEHDDYLVYQWNNIVKKTDKVFHLGDFAFKDLSVAERLNGNKILIMGNHDLHHISKYSKYFNNVYGAFMLENFLLTHCPVFMDEYSLRNSINIHGHIHNRGLGSDLHVNVSCEVIDFSPISFEQIRERIK